MKKCNRYDAKSESKGLLSKLKLSGKRITEQRKQIVEEILRFGVPFSAEELHQQLKKKEIDLATIYRSLTTFTELGVLSSVDLRDGFLRYEYIPENAHHQLQR